MLLVVAYLGTVIVIVCIACILQMDGCIDGWMYVSVGCNIPYIRYVSIGNTTDIKLADRFSRAVNFFSLTRLHDLLVGRLFLFFFSK